MKFGPACDVIFSGIQLPLLKNIQFSSTFFLASFFLLLLHAAAATALPRTPCIPLINAPFPVYYPFSERFFCNPLLRLPYTMV
jgi:hypothetical protein